MENSSYEGITITRAAVKTNLTLFTDVTATRLFRVGHGRCQTGIYYIFKTFQV